MRFLRGLKGFARNFGYGRTVGLLAIVVALIAYVYFLNHPMPAVASPAPSLAAVFAVLYFLPTVVARMRHAKGFGGIAVLNLLLGWTGLGWIAALVWAAAAGRELEPARPA